MQWPFVDKISQDTTIVEGHDEWPGELRPASAPASAVSATFATPTASEGQRFPLVQERVRDSLVGVPGGW